MARVKNELLKRNMMELEINSYLNGFRKNKKQELLDSLHNDYNITDIGLVCDTRKVSCIVLSNYIVRDVIIVTPQDNNAVITEVLGMNVLEKFLTGYDFMNNYLFLDDSGGTTTIGSKNFECGTVSFFSEQAELASYLSSGF